MDEVVQRTGKTNIMKREHEGSAPLITKSAAE
jgi:hypothetical protein